MTEPDDLFELADGLKSLKQQAKELGMFTDDRELLECSSCGLKENVSFEGVLFTFRAPALNVDTGLRFPEPDADGQCRCPGCGESV